MYPNVTQQVFVVPWEAASKQSVFITIEGVKQQQDAYTINTNTGSGTTTVTLSDTVSTETVEILGLQASSGGASVEVYQETALAAQTLFPAAGGIGWYPPSEASLIITLDGIKQNSGAFSIVPNTTFTDAQIQFVAAPGAGVVVEALGITVTGETIASPVQMANSHPDSATEEGIFSVKSVTGETQIFTLRSLQEGSNVTIADGTTVNGVPAIQISAALPTFNQIGSGTSIFDGNNEDTDPVVFRRFTATNGVGISVVSDTVTLSSTDIYRVVSEAAPTIATDERMISVNHTVTAAVAFDLPAIANFYDGETITIKDAGGNALANNITITTAGVELIDGAASYVINTNYGYVTLYSNGSNFLIIAEG